MDFTDTREEAAFRAEARAFLERQRRAQARRVRDVAEPLSASARPRSAPRTSSARRPRPGFAALTWPKEYGGRGALADLPGDLRPGGDALRRAARLLRDRPRHVHADAVRLRHRGSRSAAIAPAALRGDEIWCQLFSEPGGGLRPGRAAHARRARRRRLGHQRPEDLDVGRALRGLRHPGHAQRSQGAPSTRASPSSSST